MLEIVLILEPGTAYVAGEIPFLQVLAYMARQLVLQVEPIRTVGTLKLGLGVPLHSVISGLDFSDQIFTANVALDGAVGFLEVVVQSPVGVEHLRAVRTWKGRFLGRGRRRSVLFVDVILQARIVRIRFAAMGTFGVVSRGFR